MTESLKIHLEEQQQVRQIAVYFFSILFLVPKLYSKVISKASSITAKKYKERYQNQSKLIKFVTSCDGHVDWIKNSADKN